MTKNKTEKATLAAGCFWCIEAIFKKVGGILEVIPGYAGGDIENPTYEQVCSDTTGHAEVVQITFDPTIISYKEILKIFWSVHNPTTLNRQGHDIGSQYRSVIFYNDEEQERIAEKSKRQLQESNVWPDPIVTQIVPLKEFYPAEEYHQEYLQNYPENSYCQFVVIPKIKKFEKAFNKYITQDSGKEMQ